MGARGTYYGGIVLDGLVFHIDASKQESYAKGGIRYAQAGSASMFVDFADVSKNPSTDNATGSVINGATFSNFAPYHLSDYSTPYWHNPATTAWKDSAGIGTFYGNLEFDGVNDYVRFGLTPEMNGLTDITVSAWFYVNKFKSGLVPVGGTVSMIAGRYSNQSADNGWQLYYDNQGVMYFGGRESLAGGYLFATASMLVKQSNSSGVSNGGWYNAVGTKQGNVWSIYLAETNRYVVDGDRSVYVAPYKQSLLGTRTIGVGTTTFGTNNLYVGCEGINNTPSLHMDGRLMALSVYNRALSINDINQNYDSFAERIVGSSVPSGPEFITKWDASVALSENILPRVIEIGVNANYTYNYSVDWGDGTTTTGHTGMASHTYAVNGIYTVKITGDFPAIRLYNTATAARLIEVKQWGTGVWESMGFAFYGCRNMNVTATDAPNLSIVTDMTYMFFNCERMDGAIGGWNTSTVTDMSSMFSGASIFNQPLNSWNTASVLYMNYMFYKAYLFNQPLYSWNTGSVTGMVGMFHTAQKFNQNISSWNTGSVTQMGSMFHNAILFNQPLNLWNTSQVVNMNYMFYGASKFNQNISSWNTALVGGMVRMFAMASSFNNGGQPMLTNGNRWNVSAVTDMWGMFNGCYVFNADISNWNTINVSNMSYMFAGASAFNRNIGGWNTANVYNMSTMFNGCVVFDQNLSSWNTSQVVNMNSMFSSAIVFKNGGQPMLTNGNRWNTANVLYMNNMFSNAVLFNQSIANWDTSKVTDMTYMFYGASNFNQNISSWNTALVEYMYGMFEMAYYFNNGGQPIPRNGNSWNTVSVRDMGRMFYGTTAFNQNIGTWNVSNVSNFIDFMKTKNPATLSATNLDAIYNGWSTRPVMPNLTPGVTNISFGTAKRTFSSTTGRATLTNFPNLWVIEDGGIL